MTADFPSSCPACESPADARRDRCDCGRVHCFACGELLVEGEAQS